MKTKVIDKNAMSNAAHTKRLVNPAIAALKNIDVQSLGFDPYAAEKVSAFSQWLETFVSHAEETLSQGQAQYDNRDQALINLAHRRLSQIPDAIMLNEKAALALAANHEAQVKELSKQGFTAAQIEQISPNPKNEIDGRNQAVIDLHTETRQIEKYLADYPRFDAQLLPKSITI